ncbi:hypothetical protein OG223_32630 [Streptomyces sp. NBC_01478]|uniref:hypothetical protein n=1 Tax=Streptomyces sp. NBC_01478 TaxID=2903882 RepID=UPI002E343989|nr:hypothetical protein [Streptomyces sp. NBC_01478]
MRATSGADEDFRALARTRHLGPLHLLHLTCSPSVIHRTAPLIRRSDPGLCSVVFPLHGTLTVSQADLYQQPEADPSFYVWYGTHN